ncbi:MAG: hypothetical protein ACTSUE_03650, partial [Promethearchaeota archaeon]
RYLQKHNNMRKEVHRAWKKGTYISTFSEGFWTNPSVVLMSIVIVFVTIFVPVCFIQNEGWGITIATWFAMIFLTGVVAEKFWKRSHRIFACLLVLTLMIVTPFAFASYFPYCENTNQSSWSGQKISALVFLILAELAFVSFIAVGSKLIWKEVPEQVVPIIEFVSMTFWIVHLLHYNTL